MKTAGTFKTEAHIKKLKPLKGEKRSYFRDIATTGLYLAVAEAKRTWTVQLRANGTTVLKTVGFWHESGEATSLADARKIAESARKRARAGLAPFVSETRFEDVWKAFVRVHVSKQSKRVHASYATVRRLVGNSWNGKNVGDITSSDIDSILFAARKRAASKSGLQPP